VSPACAPSPRRPRATRRTAGVAGVGVRHDPRRSLRRPRHARWRRDLPPRNLSRDRLRKSRVRSALLALGPVQAAKGWLPPGWRERIKARWQMRERPALSPSVRAELEAALDLDLEVLGSWLRRPLRCSSWRDAVLRESLDW